MIYYDKTKLEEIFHEIIIDEDVANVMKVTKTPLCIGEDGKEISLKIFSEKSGDKTPNLVLNKFDKDFYLYVLPTES